jgi:hypothetical protein
MAPQAKLLILLAASPLLVLTLHTVVSRALTIFKPEVSPQKVCMWCVLFGNIPVGLLLSYFVLIGATAQNVEVLPTVLYSVIVYNALGYCYFHTFNMSETGRRVRILYELYRSGGLGTAEIASLYDVEDMLSVRIERLLSMGQVKVRPHALLRRKDNGLLGRTYRLSTAKIICQKN